MLVRGSKWDAAEAMLKLIIKDQTLFCYNCGNKYVKELHPCCDDPLIDTWCRHLQKLISEIRESNKVNINRYGANKAKTLRNCLSLPAALLLVWGKMFEKQYGEKLLRTHDQTLYRKDVRNMMRRVPMFMRCETI